MDRGLIFLIGYRGTGKSTVASLLAKRLGWDWVDADQRIEQRAGMSIRELFARLGEPAFRELEAEVISELGRAVQTVVALGGGAVLREETRRAIAGAGTVVWLQADPATLASRIAADPTTADRRPPLTAAGGLAEIEDLLAQRTPYYRQVAHLVVDTTGRTPHQVADEVFDLILNTEY